jgi:hypothetical protein
LQDWNNKQIDEILTVFKENLLWDLLLSERYENGEW